MRTGRGGGGGTSERLRKPMLRVCARGCGAWHVGAFAAAVEGLNLRTNSDRRPADRGCRVSVGSWTVEAGNAACPPRGANGASTPPPTASIAPIHSREHRGGPCPRPAPPTPPPLLTATARITPTLLKVPRPEKTNEGGRGWRRGRRRSRLREARGVVRARWLRRDERPPER